MASTASDKTAVLRRGPQTPRQIEMPPVEAVKYLVLPDTPCGHPGGSWTRLSPEAPSNLNHKTPTSHGPEGSPHKYRRGGTKLPIQALRSPFATQDKHRQKPAVTDPYKECIQF